MDQLKNFGAMIKYSRNSNIIDGSLDNHQVMMHIERGKYYGLNPVAKRIWELVATPRGLDEVVAILLKEFDVSEAECRMQTQAFFDKAVAYDIVRMVDGE